MILRPNNVCRQQHSHTYSIRVTSLHIFNIVACVVIICCFNGRSCWPFYVGTGRLSCPTSSNCHTKAHKLPLRVPLKPRTQLQTNLCICICVCVFSCSFLLSFAFIVCTLMLVLAAIIVCFACMSLSIFHDNLCCCFCFLFSTFVALSKSNNHQF